MITWNIEEKNLKLKYSWKISRNESSEKHNFFITVTDGVNAGLGEIAPNIRYGETRELILEQFEAFNKQASDIINIEQLEEFNPQYCNSLRFGLESAFIHYLAKKKKITVYELLGMATPKPVATSYTLPIMPVGEVPEFIKNHNLDRFEILKLKVNKDNAIDLTRVLSDNFSKQICVDANEAFNTPEEVLHYLNSIELSQLEFLEQPFPAAMVAEYKYLKPISPVKLFADESVTNRPDMEDIAQQFHGVNMKLMKAGGYLNGIRILNKAKEFGLSTMIGCMIETSLGISSAINLTGLCDYADLDGFFVLEKDPYNFVSEKEGRLYLR